MSKSLSITIATLSLKNTIKLFGSLLFIPARIIESPYKETLNKTIRDSILTTEQLTEIANDWWLGKSPYITINHQIISGLQLRLYKANFRKSGKNLVTLTLHHLTKYFIQ